MFSIVAVLFYISTNSVKGDKFPHILSKTFIFCLFGLFIYLLIAIKAGLKLYVMVILICIPLMINDIEQLLSYTCWPFLYCIYRCSLENYLFKYFAHFLILHFIFKF